MRIKNGYIILSCLILIGCSTVRPPSGFVPRHNEVEQSEYGSWVSLIHSGNTAGQNTRAYGGELIAIQNNVLYLLYQDSLYRFPTKNITRATVITHHFGGLQHFKWAGIAFIPNFIGVIIHSAWAGQFALLGLAHLPSAIIATLINHLGVNKIQYPGDVYTFESLNIYSRFPQGIPPAIDPSWLTSRPLPEKTKL